VWAGVDVGGTRKGFHVAVVDDDRLVGGPRRVATPGEVVEFLGELSTRLVAVDSPREPAPDGARSRADERALAVAVCGIRYTPDAAAVAASTYYEWIRNGLELYTALSAARFRAIECFPTASWTRWAGPRGARSRARWSHEALAGRALAGVPGRLSQDDRDAIGAALTARAFERGVTESFGTIVVPVPPTPV
jgi:predicted nuclease with RNAse H fold